MDALPTYAQTETRFLSLLEENPLRVADLLALIHTCAVIENGNKAEEWAAMLMQELTQNADFPGLYLVIKDRAEQKILSCLSIDERQAFNQLLDRLVDHCQKLVCEETHSSVGSGTD